METEGASITKELFKSLLPKLGTIRTFPMVYQHALAMFQGLKAPLIYVEQGIWYLCQVLTHGAIHSATGDLLLISLEQAQREVGIGIPAFLETSSDFCGFLLMNTWWKAVWVFIWKYGIQLTYPGQTIPQPQCIHVEHIKEHLCSCPELSWEELLSCNQCQLMLKAITLMDVISGSGQKITDNATTTLQRSTSYSQVNGCGHGRAPVELGMAERITSYFLTKTLPSLSPLPWSMDTVTT